MRTGFPLARKGARVGLLGGSFDPAHEGHVHITLEAMKRFELDEVWWLVSPGNPLKTAGPSPLEDRLSKARSVMQHPRVRVTDLETRLGTRYTVDTIQALRSCYPSVRFVWLMGADNMATIHLWDNWRTKFASVPIGVLARPGERLSARLSPAARQFRMSRLRARYSSVLASSHPPVWCFVNVPLNAQSSTAIRAQRSRLAAN